MGLRRDVAAGELGARRRVALAHDYLLAMRGAERTFAAMADAFPYAPIHTTLFDEPALDGRFAGREIHTSWLQRSGIGQKGFRKLLPLFPSAIGSLDVTDADVIVSSSSAWAHGVAKRDDALHVCYCHSPFRYAWHERTRALLEVPAPARPVLDVALDRIQRWDVRAAARVDVYVANSRITRERIRNFYNRDAEIVHPPVEIDRFEAGDAPEDWFLYVGEIVSHKRVEVILRAARMAGKTVKIVGTGPEHDRLAALYPNAEFLGRVDDRTLAGLYRRAAALLVPNIEEFGITAVEAQASGRPVIGPTGGGTEEIITHGVTGLLLSEPTAEAYAEVMRDFDFAGFDSSAATRNAVRFSVDTFQARLGQIVAETAGWDHESPLVAGRV